MRPTVRLAASLSAVVLVAAGAGAQATLITHARVFDGASVIGIRDVLVRNGVVAKVAVHITAPAGANTVDGTGKTLLPGLIDAHTHAFGTALADALAYGVTTELDMFTDVSEASARRSEQRQGNAERRADLFSAGTLVTVKGGHGTEYGLPIPTLASPDSAQAFVDARIAEGSDYIKIILDNGSTYGRTIPTVSPEMLRAVIKATHARGKLAVVHVGSLADARVAIESGADGLMHLFIDKSPDADFGRLVAAHHAFVVPTLTVLQSVAGGSDMSPLAADPRLAPYLSPAGRATLLARFPLKANGRYEAAEASVRQLRAAHVPILAGTDATNAGTAHGISMHRELELLVHAGLTPTEALASATSVPARAFGLEDRGRIAVGQRADLVLVDGDPTTDITATRSIAQIWKGGVAFDRAAFAQALASARAAAGASAQKVGRLPLLSTFDAGTPSASFGAGWAATTDSYAGGSSTAVLAVVDGGANGTAKALEIHGDIAPGLPYAWGGAMLFPGDQPMASTDLSKAREIRFWARGDGATYQVMVFAESKGRIPLVHQFVAGAEWKEFVFPIASFDGIDGHDIQGIAITAGPQPGAYRIRVDELRIQ